MKSVVVFCLLLVLVQQISAQSYTFNFPYNPNTVRQYGVGHGDDTFVMDNPYDFALDAQGNPVVSDIGRVSVFRFFRTFLNNFTETSSTNLGQIYSLQRNGNSYYALARNAGQNNVYSTSGFQTGIKLNSNSVGSDPRGIAFDQASSTLFISDFQNDVVYAYSSDDFSLKYTIGGSGPTSATTLDGPFRMALDRNGLWVCDSINNRVLHYPTNSRVADIVIGQNDFGVNAAGNASNPSATLRPYSVAYENSQDTLYISDATGRISKYVGPFRTGQNATGVLDTANDLSAQNVVTVKLFTYTDSSIRLFLLDNANERVTSVEVKSASSKRRA